MNDQSEKRRKDDDEARSKRQLKQEIERNNILAESSIGNLVHELQVHQAELEAQNQELRQAQQQLEETRDRYADLYDFAPVGYLTFDESGKVLEINLTGAAMLGRERQNIVNHPFSFFLSQKEMQNFAKHLKYSFLEQGNVVSELKLKFNGFDPRFIRLESVLVPGKKICRTVMIDITQEYLASASLQTNLAAQEALLQAIPAVVFYQDKDLKFIAVSQIFANFVDRSISELIGKTPLEILPQEIAEDFERASREVLEKGGVFVVPEYELHDINGNLIYLSLVRAPYQDTKGNIIGMVGAGIDISPIKNASNLHQELLLENRKLTRNLFEIQEQERRRIARELHDELGQWLTAIQAEASAVLNISVPDFKISDGANAIIKSANAMHEVVRNMLRHLRPSLLDELGLADSLHELQRQWCRSYPKMVCEFNIDVPLEGFSEQINITIYRLIQEALNNIANHSRARKIVVTISRETGMIPEEKILVLKVEDDGVGFDLRQRRTGVGLLGMRERVIAAGGTFDVNSEPGKGTCIQVVLPLYDRILP